MSLAPVAGTNPASLDWLVIPGHASEPRLQFPDEIDDGWEVHVDGVEEPLETITAGDVLLLSLTAEQAEAYRDRGYVLVDPAGVPKAGGRIRRWAGRTVPPSSSTVTMQDGPQVNVYFAEAGPPGPPGENGSGTVDSVLRSGITQVTDGDLYAAVANRSGGDVEGGVFRRLTSALFPWSYNPTFTPSDVGIGTAIHVPWYGTVSGIGGLGPAIQTGFFGPRGVFNTEGRLDYAQNQTAFGFEPVAFIDALRFANSPGSTRTMSPAWSIISARVRIGNGGVTTLIANDTNRGGADYCSTPVWLTENGGEIDGVTNMIEATHFYAGGVVSGDIHLSRRIVYGGDDILKGTDLAFGGPSTYRDILTGQFPNADPDTSVIDEQIFLRVPYLDGATRNFGIENASGTRDVPYGVTVSGASTSIPIQATNIHLANSGSAVTLTSVPTIPAGLNGQRIQVTNLLNPVTLQAAATLAGSRLAETITLQSGDTVELQYSSAAGLWIIVSSHLKSTKFRELITVNDGVSTNGSGTLAPSGLSVYQQAAHANPMVGVGVFAGILGFIALGAGGAGALDAFLVRGGVNILQAGNSSEGWFKGGQLRVNRTITAASDTLVAADATKALTFNRATAVAVSVPGSGTAIPADSPIPVRNIGAGTVTFAGSSSGVFVTGTTLTLTQGQSGHLVKPDPTNLNLWMLMRS